MLEIKTCLTNGQNNNDTIDTLLIVVTTDTSFFTVRVIYVGNIGMIVSIIDHLLTGFCLNYQTILRLVIWKVSTSTITTRNIQ